MAAKTQAYTRFAVAVVSRQSSVILQSSHCQSFRHSTWTFSRQSVI